MAPGSQPEDDFRALGLEPGASPAEVKRAYRGLVKKWHPDRHHTENYEARALAEEKFREIDQAYRRISKTWGKTSHSRPSASREFSNGSGSVAPGPRPTVRFHQRPPAGFQIFFRTRRVQLLSFSVAVAAFILIVFYPLLSNIGPERVLRISKMFGRHFSKKEAPGASKPAAPLAPQASSPTVPKPGATAYGRFFTLGSSERQVLDVQGRPTQILGDTWIYGVSEVNFKNGAVCGYNNFDGALRVRLDPGVSRGVATGYITIGSTERQVLLVQGTPTRIRGNRWYYGFAEVRLENGLVVGYDNYFGTLKMRLVPSSPPGPGKKTFFTKGSTPDEVLAVQGTPTAVHPNRWSYNFDYVIFRNGKVRGVVDADGALHFANPERRGLAGGP